MTVCSYSFDHEAAINWGRVVALITVHFRSPTMTVYGLAHLAWKQEVFLANYFYAGPVDGRLCIKYVSYIVEGDRGAGEERAGGGISTMAGSGREIQKGSQRDEPSNVSWLPFDVFRGLKQNFIHEKGQKTKIRARDKKKTALLPVKLETFPSRLHHRTWMR